MIRFPIPKGFPGRMSAYFDPDERKAWIETLDTSSEPGQARHRRQGHGRRAVAAFEAWAKAHGAVVVTAQVPLDTIEFWVKLGYSIGDKPRRNRYTATKEL